MFCCVITPVWIFPVHSDLPGAAAGLESTYFLGTYFGFAAIPISWNFRILSPGKTFTPWSENSNSSIYMLMKPFAFSFMFGTPNSGKILLSTQVKL